MVNFADYNLFVEALGDTEEEWNEAHSGCPYLNADINGDGFVNLGDINPFAGLGYGNAAAARTYTWDCENRLVALTPTVPRAGDKQVTFAYDYQGRRIRKQVETYGNGQWSVTEVRLFVYQGWRIVLELDGLNSNAVLRKYTWGLDLAGQNGSVNSLEGAGGIGGLLAVEEPQTVGDPHRYVYFYDANGNVGQVADLFAADPNAAIKARYEYDPYGNLTVQSGPYADTNPFRWSTKYFDAETGLSDFGGRYYNASLGRWINRDPIGECGGRNLYAYVGNDPIDRVDYLGRLAMPCPRGMCGCPKNDPPPTAQPTTKPQTQPAMPQDSTDSGPCPGLSEAISANQSLIDELNASGCMPAIVCNGPRCGKEIPIGAAAYSKEPLPPMAPNPNGYITACGAVSADRLAHELIHARQDCTPVPLPPGTVGPPQRLGPPTDPTDVACRELQAVSCSGNCNGAPDRKKCIKANCAYSLLNWCRINPGKCSGVSGDPKNTGDVAYAYTQCSKNYAQCADCEGRN